MPNVPRWRPALQPSSFLRQTKVFNHHVVFFAKLKNGDEGAVFVVVVDVVVDYNVVAFAVDVVAVGVVPVC